MGDEPYLAPLPWVVFAVMDRFDGHGVSWASFGAIVTIVVLLSTHRREQNGGARNVLLAGALAWFSLLLLAGLIWEEPTGWLAQNGRTASALGFVVIAFASVARTPIAEFYTRPYIRPSRWHSPGFVRFNVMVTLAWAVGFSIVALSHLVALKLDTPQAYTMFNWVIPIATLVIVASRAKTAWDALADDADDATFDHDALAALAFDWNREQPKSTER
jgi:hypothetical protein